MMNESNFLGKIMFLVVIIIATCYHSLFGILLVLLYIIFNSNTIETFESKKDQKSSKDSISSFKEKHCKNGELTKDGETYKTPDSIKKAFPNLKFTNEHCNPCDDSCEFEIISSDSMLNNEQNLRPTNSNEVVIDRKSVGEKKE